MPRLRSLWAVAGASVISGVFMIVATMLLVFQVVYQHLMLTWPLVTRKLPIFEETIKSFRHFRTVPASPGAQLSMPSVSRGKRRLPRDSRRFHGPRTVENGPLQARVFPELSETASRCEDG